MENPLTVLPGKEEEALLTHTPLPDLSHSFVTVEG